MLDDVVRDHAIQKLQMEVSELRFDVAMMQRRAELGREVEKVKRENEAMRQELEAAYSREQQLSTHVCTLHSRHNFFHRCLLGILPGPCPVKPCKLRRVG